LDALRYILMKSVRYRSLSLLTLAVTGFSGHAQPGSFSSDSIIYKRVDSVDLYLKVIYPPSFSSSDTWPAAVYFFGGGWKSGTMHHLLPQAKYFASRGIVGFLVDYRVYSRHRTTPFEALSDAKSAIRFIKKHTERFHIAPNRLIGIGASAGGQLAAASCLINGYNNPKDDTTISTALDALVLFNPVLDNGPGGYGHERIGTQYKNFSPLHNIRAGAPPTLIFLGTKDELVPVEAMEYYKMTMERTGGRCELLLYDGQEHGFFNFRNRKFFNETLLEAQRFLTSLGYLKADTD